MMTLLYLTKRNCKVYFKDKGMFFTSLITPLILLVLYATFLAKVFKDSMMSSFPAGFPVDEKLVNGTVGAQLVSSLLAVSCITVAFCTNLLMVKDKVDEVRRDLTVAPVSATTLSISYFLGSLLATLIVCYVTVAICFVYLAIVGWFLSFADVVIIICDVFLLSLFGTALSSLVNCGLKTNGQGSAVGTVVSAGYGFICGAYMPLSNFAEGLRNVLGFLPGTYGTSIMRNCCLSGVFREMAAQNYPTDVIEGIKDSLDCNLYFFGNGVSLTASYLVLSLSIVALVGIYVLVNVLLRRKKR